MDHLASDLRHAVRSLARTPGYTLASALALTLGVGAVTALFTVLWAVLVRPLPYHDPDRLVTILHGDSVSAPRSSPADYLDLRREARSFTDIAAAQAWDANLDADGRAERMPALQVSGTLFAVLGVPAAHGPHDRRGRYRARTRSRRRHQRIAVGPPLRRAPLASSAGRFG